jgi:hypothetical protein
MMRRNKKNRVERLHRGSQGWRFLFDRRTPDCRLLVGHDPHFARNLLPRHMTFVREMYGDLVLPIAMC